MSQAGEDEAGTWNVEERQGRWIQEEQGEDLLTDLRGSRVEGVITHFRLPAGCKHQEAWVSGFVLVLPVAATRGRNVLLPESRPPRREPEMDVSCRGDPGCLRPRVRHLGY